MLYSNTKTARFFEEIARPFPKKDFQHIPIDVLNKILNMVITSTNLSEWAIKKAEAFQLLLQNWPDVFFSFYATMHQKFNDHNHLFLMKHEPDTSEVESSEKCYHALFSEPLKSCQV